MTPQIVAELSKKHGVNFLLICAIFWMNNRLSDVENKLYDCLGDQIHMTSKPLSERQDIKTTYTYAILPTETRYGKYKRKMEGKNA